MLVRTSVPTRPMSVAMFLRIPWDRANQRLPMTLELLDADGQPVSLDGQVVAIPAEIEASRLPGLEHGSMLDAAYAVTVGSLPLTPGRYEWRLTFADRLFSAFFSARASG